MFVVPDTNVLLSATLWEESVAQKLLVELIQRDVRLVTSDEILSEYHTVVIRDFPYTENDAHSFVQFLLRFLTIVHPEEHVRAVPDDQDDDKIVECAIAAEASIIITYDKDLLRLKEFRGIRIIRPEEMLSSL